MICNRGLQGLVIDRVSWGGTLVSSSYGGFGRQGQAGLDVFYALHPLSSGEALEVGMGWSHFLRQVHPYVARALRVLHV